MSHPTLTPAEATQGRLILCALPEWLALWLDQELHAQITACRWPVRANPVAVGPALTGSGSPGLPTTRIDKMRETAARFGFVRDMLAAGHAAARRQATDELVGLEIGDRIIGLGERLGCEMRHPDFEMVPYVWRVRLRNLLTEIAGLGVEAYRQRRGRIVQFSQRIEAANTNPKERP